MSEIATNEDLWGYGKRLRFVRDSITAEFPDRPAFQIRILDVGCGSATLLGLPLARLGYDLTGIDTHGPSVAVAAQLAKGLSNGTFVCGSVEEFCADPFDVVILSEVLEHVTDPDRLLTASLQHLKTGGLVIVTVPNGYGEFEWDSWLFRSLGFQRLVERYEARRSTKNGERRVTSGTENHENGHVQFFTQQKLHRLFDSCGITIRKKKATTLASGPFAGHLLARLPGFIGWNAHISDKLPMNLSSGWLFALRRRSEVDK